MSSDVFDLEVYGQDDAPASQKITSYTFEVIAKLKENFMHHYGNFAFLFRFATVF